MTGSQIRQAVLYGRDHTELGDSTVAQLGPSLAVGTTAGAVALPGRSTNLNEDSGAVLDCAEAALLVVADAHFGREASERVVDHVLSVLAEDPISRTATDEQLVTLVFGAGLEVVRETSLADSEHPNSRTTLALAVVTGASVRWASFGDSCIVLVEGDHATRLDTPRSVYLGEHFTPGDVGGALTRGRAPSSVRACLVLATDGLLDCLGTESDLAAATTRAATDVRSAAEVAEKLLSGALESGVSDAVTVAVALSSLELPRMG